MGFDIRTQKRTITALAIAALMLMGTLAPALAQGRRGGRSNDRRHYGWTQGKHRGWTRSSHRGRMWRDDDRRARRREFRRERRQDRRAFRRYYRRNSVSSNIHNNRFGRVSRRDGDWRDRRR